MTMTLAEDGANHNGKANRKQYGCRCQIRQDEAELGTSRWWWNHEDALSYAQIVKLHFAIQYY